MRLWFIMHRSDKDIFIKDDVYYKRFSASNTKKCDIGFTKDINVDGVWVKTAPMMCFASLAFMDTCLSLFSLINSSDIYSIPLGGNLDGAIMLEVEVQEKNVLCMHDLKIPIDKSECEYGDITVIDNFKSALRGGMADKRVVALVDRIRCSDVVSQYYFDRTADGKISIINDIQRKDAFPLTKATTIYIRDDCRLFPGRHATEPYEEDDEFNFIQENAMSGAPRYFTLAEARAACDMNTGMRISKKCREMGIGSDQYSKYLIADIFPNGLRME